MRQHCGNSHRSGSWFNNICSCRLIKEIKDNLMLSIILLTLYSLNRFTPIFKSTIFMREFFKNYFNDFLATILLLAYVNLLLGAANYKIITELTIIMFLGMLSSYTWEFITPIILRRGTSDWLDVVCYLFGSLYYWLFINYSVNFKRNFL